MQHDDSIGGRPRAIASRQLVTFGVLALLFMVILGATVSGPGQIVGTLVLAAVCLTCFAMAVRASHHDPK